MKGMQCRSCGTAMGSSGLDRRLGILTCQHCSAIYDLTRLKDRVALLTDDKLSTSSNMKVERDRLERPPVALPSKFAVVRGTGRLKVSWRWFGLQHIFVLCFAIAWNLFLVVWYSLALADDGPLEMAQLLMLVFPLAHVAVGISMGYYAIAGLLNSSSLEVTPQELKVRHYPLPWLPMPTIALSELEQLYCTRKIQTGKNGSSVSFELRAVTRQNAGLLLLGGLADLDQALWLEQEIEKQLGIRDRPVAGEVIQED